MHQQGRVAILLSEDVLRELYLLGARSVSIKTPFHFQLSAKMRFGELLQNSTNTKRDENKSQSQTKKAATVTAFTKIPGISKCCQVLTLDLYISDREGSYTQSLS